MATSSLSKFTVPLASDQSASAQGLLMPKLSFRFRVSFENFGVSNPKTELTKQVMEAKRPSVTFGDITVDAYNSKVRLAGKPEWADMTVKLRDDASGNVSRLVGEQLQKQFDFMNQASAASGIDYKFLTRLEMLDGGNGASTPVVLETWEIVGCYLQGVDYGTVNYANNEVVTVDLTIKYDNATQAPIGTGIGSAVARRLGTTITG
jgi:hypothetical protein